MELTDIVPTLLEAPRAARAPEYVQGKSLGPVLRRGGRRGQAPGVRASEYHDALQMPDATHANMLRNERYKLVYYHGHPSGELYDLEKDPTNSGTCGTIPTPGV